MTIIIRDEDFVRFCESLWLPLLLTCLVMGVIRAWTRAAPEKREAWIHQMCRVLVSLGIMKK